MTSFHRIYSNNHGYPTLIRYIQLLVCGLTIGAALWYDLFLSGTISFSSSSLLLNPGISFKTIFQAFTAPFILVYPGTSFSLFFDLVVLNALLAPIYTFVLSFVGKKDFLYFLIGLIFLGEISFLISSTYVLSPPCSFFSAISLSIVVFWAMLHSQGQTFFLLAFPISPSLYVSAAAAATLYPIFVYSEYAKLISTGVMVCASYLFAVIRYHLRSNIQLLEPLERFLQL